MKNFTFKNPVTVSKELEELTIKYLTNRKTELETLKHLTLLNDFHSIQVFGHRLKGNAGSYGFDELGKCGADIETASLNRDLPLIRHLIINIETYLTSIEVKFE